MRAPLSVERSLRALVSEGIKAGSLEAGAKLPTERELVERLGVPRSAVRRALASLESEGVVYRHVGRGTFLTEVVSSDQGDASTDTSPAEIMQVRLLLEPQIAPLASRSATHADLDNIARRLDEGEAAMDTDYQRFESADGALHRAIAVAARNGLLLSLFDVLNSARSLPVWGSLKKRTSTPELRRCYHAEHVAIVQALRDRDPEGSREAMRIHLEHVSATLLGDM